MKVNKKTALVAIIVSMGAVSMCAMRGPVGVTHQHRVVGNIDHVRALQASHDELKKHLELVTQKIENAKDANRKKQLYELRFGIQSDLDEVEKKLDAARAQLTKSSIL